MKKRPIVLLSCVAALALVLAGLLVWVFVGLGEKGPDLYWNLEGPHSQTAAAPEREEGNLQIRFAHDGQEVLLTVASQELVNRILTMDAMVLELDKADVVVNAVDAASVASEVCDGKFIKKFAGDTIHVNSSLAMNGIEAQFRLGKQAKIYDVTDGKVSAMELSQLKPMDGLYAYANEKGQVTHVFRSYRQEESAVYWRVSRSYSSSKKETSRKPDEAGLYSVDFYSCGQIVTLQTADKALVTAIDQVSSNPHFGFTFDENGYINGIIKSALGIRSLLACESYDITHMGETVTATELLSNKGYTWTGAVREDCRVYDISSVAQAEGRLGQQVDGVQLGDRVTVFTDTEGNAVEIFVQNRLVDEPMFFSTSRKYDSQTKQTSRTPDAEGWYEVTLWKEGDSEASVYKTRDKELMTYLDAYASRCFAIRADENNVLQQVYYANCIFGGSAWSNGGIVANTVGTVVTRMSYGKTTTSGNAVMMPDCKVYNVSTVGEYGAQTKLQAGDYIYAFTQPSGEVVCIFVVRRCIGGETMYFNLDRQYDDRTKQTTRQSDVEGWYYFDLTHNGEKVRLKTGSKAVADKIDSYSPGAVSLQVTADIIDAAHAPNYAWGGSQVANGYQYTGVNEKGVHTAVKGETATTFTLAEDCGIYDITAGGASVDTIREGDTLVVYTDRFGKAKAVYIY